MKTKKPFLICTIVIFLVAVIPLLIIGLYNHPSNDDYLFGASVYKAFNETRSIVPIVREGINVVLDNYNSWQGSFIAIFLFAIQPAVFGYSLYKIVTPFMIAIITLSTMLFTRSILKTKFKLNYHTWIPISLIITILSLEFVPCPVQSLYWYNGSIYYTFFYSLMLIMFSLIIESYSAKRAKGAYIILSSLIGVLIGGGNYITPLLSIILLSLSIIYLFSKKQSKINVILPFIFLLISFTINILAPGNKLRLEAYSYHKPSFFLAIAQSLYYGVIYIIKWTSPLLLLTALILGLVLANILNKRVKKIKCPIFAITLSYLLISAQFSPATYSMATEGAGRELDIIFYSYVILLVFNITNVFLWALNLKDGKLKKSLIEMSDKYKTNKYGKSLITLVFIAAIVFTNINIGKMKIDFDKMTTISAVHSLITGEAKRYSSENDYRHEMLMKDDRNIEFLPFNNRPYLLFYSDLSEDKDYLWSNVAITKYYEKDSVVIKSK